MNLIFFLPKTFIQIETNLKTLKSVLSCKYFEIKTPYNSPCLYLLLFLFIISSIFERSPVHQSGVHELLHWYDSKPWEKEELRRHFPLTDQNNKELRMPDIEFFDFNLQAVSFQNLSVLQQPTDLQKWLDFLAKAHRKQPEEIESLKTTELKEAYHMVEIDSWNEKLKDEYREQQVKRHNISHYVEGEKKQAREKGREGGEEETTLRMIDLGLKDEVVLKATLFSPEHLEMIKRNNNK
jgi:predicted transposase/invertase (TIGR01784 family)